MSGDPVPRRTRSAIRVTHIVAIALVGLALGLTAQGYLTLAIVALCLATIAQIFASDVMRVISCRAREANRARRCGSRVVSLMAASMAARVVRVSIVSISMA